VIETARLILRPWREADREPFAAINGDPRVNEWLGGPIDRAQSDAVMDRIQAQIATDGFGFFAAELKAGGRLVGMIGLRRQTDAPPGPGLELGWRLAAEAQGQGLATEGAQAALDWGFASQPAGEILDRGEQPALPGGDAPHRHDPRPGPRLRPPDPRRRPSPPPPRGLHGEALRAAEETAWTS
jgi:hypothetical protein